MYRFRLEIDDKSCSPHLHYAPFHIWLYRSYKKKYMSRWSQYNPLLSRILEVQKVDNWNTETKIQVGCQNLHQEIALKKLLSGLMVRFELGPIQFEMCETTAILLSNNGSIEIS